MSYAIIRVQKLKAFSGIGRHIDRVDMEGNIHIPANANTDRVKRNIHWDINGKAHEQYEWPKIIKDYSLAKRVNDRIKEGYLIQKAIRKDAVKALEYILTSDSRKMEQLEKDPKLFKQWLHDNRSFIESIHGKENIVAFSLHRDEETAHIHAVVVPLTPDGRLTMEPFVGSPKRLIQLQNSYAEVMERYGMKRGKSGSRTRHERPDKELSQTKSIQR